MTVKEGNQRAIIVLLHEAGQAGDLLLTLQNRHGGRGEDSIVDKLDRHLVLLGILVIRHHLLGQLDHQVGEGHQHDHVHDVEEDMRSRDLSTYRARQQTRNSGRDRQHHRQRPVAARRSGQQH